MTTHTVTKFPSQGTSGEQTAACFYGMLHTPQGQCKQQRPSRRAKAVKKKGKMKALFTVDLVHSNNHHHGSCGREAQNTQATLNKHASFTLFSKGDSNMGAGGMRYKLKQKQICTCLYWVSKVWSLLKPGLTGWFRLSSRPPDLLLGAYIKKWHKDNHLRQRAWHTKIS